MTLGFDRVSAGYRGRIVFRDATFALGRGQILGLIGPNGAGKTTLLRVAAGLIRPAAGRVDRDAAVIYFGGEATMPGNCRADRWSELIGLPVSDRRRLRRLSRGTRQITGLRAWLARTDWDVGLLDEPWEGLDPAGARWLRDALAAHRERGAACIVSSHRLHDVAEVCDAHAFLAQGTLRMAGAADPAHGRLDAAALMRMFDEIARQP